MPTDNVPATFEGFNRAFNKQDSAIFDKDAINTKEEVLTQAVNSPYPFCQQNLQ
jgi:hypothetical protein